MFMLTRAAYAFSFPSSCAFAATSSASALSSSSVVNFASLFFSFCRLLLNLSYYHAPDGQRSTAVDEPVVGSVMTTPPTGFEPVSKAFLASIARKALILGRARRQGQYTDKNEALLKRYRTEKIKVAPALFSILAGLSGRKCPV
jgi:hypothetical protein